MVTSCDGDGMTRNNVVRLMAIDGATLQVRGLDCLDGTPLIDLKPERGMVSD